MGCFDAAKKLLEKAAEYELKASMRADETSILEPDTSDNAMQASQPDAEAMIENLAAGHDTLSATLKTALDAAGKVGDDVTVDLFTQRMMVSQKTAWMLRSSL